MAIDGKRWLRMEWSKVSNVADILRRTSKDGDGVFSVFLRNTGKSWGYYLIRGIRRVGYKNKSKIKNFSVDWEIRNGAVIGYANESRLHFLVLR